jgi:hypothetical protein
MSSDAEPRPAGPETSGTSSSGEWDNRNGDGNVEEHQKSEDGQNLKDTNEYRRERAHLERITQSLMEEWKPEGLSERNVITELAGFVWLRERWIRAAYACDSGTEKSKQPDTNGGQTEKEKPEDVVDEIMRIGLQVSPKERIQREIAFLDKSIQKAIEHLVFLKTAKKRIRDCSSEDVTVSAVSRPGQARAPRGNYRRSRTEKPSDNSGRDLVTSYQTIVAK